VESKTSERNESGEITRIAPSLNYQYSQARLDLTLDYAYFLTFYAGLEAEDHDEQSLEFLTKVNHVPNQWESYISANVSEQNVDRDGMLIVNDLFASPNTKELRTGGVGTEYRGLLGRGIQYLTSLNADYAEFEDQASTHSVGFSLGMNNSVSQKKLTWHTDLESNKYYSEDEKQISTLEAGINYRFNQKYSTFITADKADADKEILNDTNTVIGFWWHPNRASSVQIGAGRRGDAKSYTLDSNFIRKKLMLSASYSEHVTTTRAITLEEIANPTGAVTFNQSLSIIPVLVKRSNASATLNGRRTKVSLGYFDQRSFQNGTDAGSEKSDGFRFAVTRILSGSSTMVVNMTTTDLKAAESSTVDDIQFMYHRKLSRNANWNAGLRKTRQSSSLAENEYDQQSISFTLNANF
jgi:uncharacterized protein (PEP-CTERM system associated)